ncbi:MAG TPA: hypothetical protein VGE08_17510 [Steroidobacter sp.]|uniref:hypothetical protein n=1 Tax=Steroidobacter sp. TaxID=1978227 RepID=UPI002ED80F27
MNLPCLDAVRDEINRRCAELHSRGRLDETFTISQTDQWTAVIGVTCVNGERFTVELDLLELMIEGGFVEALTQVLH